MDRPSEARWLLLIHQIPPRPPYLRVKVGRRLQALGAVAVKNSVYVLPRGESALEDFQWVRGEIVAGGGDASVCEARFVEGLSDEAVESLFNAARETDYTELAREARSLHQSLTRRGKRPARPDEQVVAALTRLRKRLQDLVAIDFFAANGREAVEGLLSSAETALRPSAGGDPGGPDQTQSPPRARTWVTRTGVHVDRIASAWLIRRFIDPEARFEFVRSEDYRAKPGDLRFDMFEAEFTHEGELCTFEVLLRRFGIAERALREIGEIVHDVDLKDGKFSRPEGPGLARLMAGIAMRHKEDEARLQDGASLFDALYESFRRTP